MNKFKLRIWDPVLNKGAIWTYWKGAFRDTGKNEGATSVLQFENREGWFWYIPLHDNRVSVGVVAPFDYLFEGRGTHEQTYHEEIDRCVAVKRRIEGAERITGYFATRDYSYRCEKVAGDGWVIIGDAFGFLDPLYSSGVLLALKSGEMAADAIVEGLASGDTSAAQLGKWGPTLNQGIDRMRRLVCEYYNGFSFGNFMREHPGNARAGDRPLDRRPVHRQGRRSLGADGSDVSRSGSRAGCVECRHATRSFDDQAQRVTPASRASGVSTCGLASY